MARVQVFEEEFVRPTVHRREVSYRPLASVLGEPVDVVHCERATCAYAMREVGGSWVTVSARPGSPSATRLYSVRLGPLRLANARLFLFRDMELASVATTDSEGRASFDLPVDRPYKARYTVSLVPAPAPFRTPFQDAFELTVWLVTCRVTNRTDIWPRFVGRSFVTTLPRIFWREAPWTVIGLAIPGGTQYFADVVPAFGDMEVTLEYGVSAWCNTEEPYPPMEKCIEYRRNTWWRFEVEAYNGSETRTVSGDLNLDRHLRVKVTSRDVRAEVVRPEGAET